MEESENVNGDSIIPTSIGWLFLKDLLKVRQNAAINLNLPRRIIREKKESFTKRQETVTTELFWRRMKTANSCWLGNSIFQKMSSPTTDKTIKKV